MRRYPRIVVLAALVALAPVLAGCENFDPDKLDFLGLNKKKPLPGERQPVFPNGVPGVTQGIPPEYQKSYVEQQQQERSGAPPQRCSRKRRRRRQRRRRRRRPLRKPPKSPSPSRNPSAKS